MNYLGFIGPFALIVILLFAIALPIIALIDILRSDFKGNDKIVWILIVLLANLFGTLLYFMIGTKQKIK
ncbi:PLDc N-terminal domain-containing protein [Polaribacter gochangensis]|uniref:PLDc N-terminal domain-containing protein n=1 Tax=Polaribacter gochangensis TaxID=3252903 RepID=UPI0039048347